MKILLVQTSFLGDTVLSTPLLAALKCLYPHCELWMMVTPQAQPLVALDPLLAGVLVFEKRGRDRGLRGMLRKARELHAMGFDRVYSLHKSARTSILLYAAKIPSRIGFRSAKFSFLYTETRPRARAEHDVLRNLSLLDGEDLPPGFEPELRLYAPDTESGSAELEKLFRAKQIVALVPGSAWPTKMWHWENYREAATHFIRAGKTVVVLGGPDERDVGRIVAEGLAAHDLTGKLSLPDFLWVIRQASLVICNDSLALHVASAFKIPTVAVFCATSPQFGFGPWRNRAEVIEEETLRCKPCRRHGSRSCPTGTELCMRGVPANRVIAAAERVAA